MSSFDVVAIGAGPGGYVAAIRAAQLGLNTAVIEREALGGVCLNRGCIPSKAMLHLAEVVDLVRNASALGIEAGEPRVLYAEVLARREAAVARLRQGVTNLMKGNGIEVLAGTARVTGPNALEITGGEWSAAVSAAGGPEARAPGDTSSVEFRNLIVATGSRAAMPPIPGIQLTGVIDSDAALTLPEPPPRVVVIGGGAVGVEWAEIWHALGSQVTVVELLHQLLPSMDSELVRELTRAWSRKGIESRTGARVQTIKQIGKSIEVLVEVGDRPDRLPADAVLVATGRRPNLSGLGLEAAGVHFDEQCIRVDAQMRTNVPHVFAVGDVTGGPLLAHVASHQGIVAAEAIAGVGGSFDAAVVPAVVFTDPEIASVGLTERAAAEQNIPIVVGRFPFAASGRAAATGQTAGLVKLVARQESGAVLGAHIAGPRAGDLISEAALAVRLGATLHDLAHTIHPHPTFSEAIMEAAWAALGTPLHIPPRRGASSRTGASPDQRT